ncbi:unknown [Clostridium sp. CAG:273]|nr:unknown [Clostridium sp. CAG:273]
MISEYISKKYKGAIHIKMRDIIKEMYKEYDTKLSYEEWQEELENKQREFF